MGTRLLVGLRMVAAHLETKNLYSRVLPANINMRVALVAVCLMLVVLSHVNAFMTHHFYYGKDAPQPARDEIAQLVKTLNFYDSLKNRNEVVADDRAQKDAFANDVKRNDVVADERVIADSRQMSKRGCKSHG